MKKVTKRSMLLILSILLVAIISIGGTFSYLNTKTRALDNKLRFEPLDIEIVEEFDGWDLKEVSLKNLSDETPGVVRAMLVPRVEDKDGNYVVTDLGALSEPDGNNEVQMGDFTFEMDADWADHWFYKDGFFYCKKVLEPGETTPILLHKVSLTDDTAAGRKKYEGLEVKVDVIAHILQAEGGAPEEEWNVVVRGDAVSAS